MKTRKTRLNDTKETHTNKKLVAILMSTAAIFAVSTAYAQNETETVTESSDDDTVSILDEIIVTGVSKGGSGITKFESSLSSTTFDEDKLRELGSSNTAGLFAEIPGVWAEATGGGSGNNIFVRGIPSGGAYEFSKVNVDGLPLIEKQGGFVNPDGLFKQDLSIERLEGIRGGSSGVFASNSPGGLFNFITKKGSQDFEGIVQVEAATFDYLRADVFFSGPIDDRTTFTLGGFYRGSDGVRDAGFRGDEGGQIRASITRDFDKGDVTVRASVLDDRNIFYLPFPTDLEGDDLVSLPGLDALRGTNVTDDARFIDIIQPGGDTRTRDSADGIHNQAINFGTEVNYDFGSGWTLSNKNRFTSASWDANLHIIFGFDNAENFLAGRLADAQAAFPGTTELALRFLSDGVGTTSTFDIANQNGNGQVFDQFLFAWDTSSDLFVNDFSISKSFETGFGTHDFSVGNYISISSYDAFNQTPTFLTEVASSPRLLNIFATDGTDVLGAVTQNGITAQGSVFPGLLANNYNLDTDIVAYYVSDNWILNDRFNVDAAIRYESQEFTGVYEQQGEFDLSDVNPFTRQSGLETLADDAVNAGTGVFTPFALDHDETSWSIGANYVLQDWLSVYGRISDGFRTPSAFILTNNAAGDPATISERLQNVPVNTLLQIEGGIKINLDKFQAFVTVYDTDFEDQASSIAAPQDADGNTINATPLQSAQTTGIEAEIQIGPFAGFSLNAKATFQEPELAELSFIGPDADRVAIAADASALIGNQVPRVPETIITARPKYEFQLSDDLDGSIFLNIFHVGDRFADFANSALIQEYTTLGAGWQLNYRNISFQGTVENLTDEIGFTEGNPRGDLLGSGSGPTIATFGRSVHGRNARFSVTYRF